MLFYIILSFPNHHDARQVWKSFLDNGGGSPINWFIIINLIPSLGHETVVCRPLKLETITQGRITASLQIADHNRTSLIKSRIYLLTIRTWPKYSQSRQSELGTIILTSSSPPRSITDLHTTPSYASPHRPLLQNLHGGIILSLTDTMGSLAISTHGQWMTGVSTDINASFVRPAGKLGEQVFMDCRVVGIGESDVSLLLAGGRCVRMVGLVRESYTRPTRTLLARGHNGVPCHCFISFMV